MVGGLTRETLFLQRALSLPFPASADPDDVDFAVELRGAQTHLDTASPELDTSHRKDTAQRPSSKRKASTGNNNPLERKTSASKKAPTVKKARASSKLPPHSKIPPAAKVSPVRKAPATQKAPPTPKAQPGRNKASFPKKAPQSKSKEFTEAASTPPRSFVLPQTFDGDREDSPLSSVPTDSDPDSESAAIHTPPPRKRRITIKMTNKRAAEAGPSTPRKKAALSPSGGDDEQAIAGKSPGGRKAAVPWTTEETLALHKAVTELALRNLKEIGQAAGLESRVGYQINHKLRSECKKILEGIGGKGAGDWVETIKVGANAGGGGGSSSKKNKGRKATASSEQDEDGAEDASA